MKDTVGNSLKYGLYGLLILLGIITGWCISEYGFGYGLSVAFNPYHRHPSVSRNNDAKLANLESAIERLWQDIKQEELDNEGAVRQSLVIEHNEAKEALEAFKAEQNSWLITRLNR